jgi:copper chaperone CopZ
MEKMTIAISGMSCGHCVRAISDALRTVDGVRVDDVQVGSATVAFDPAATPADRVRAAVTDAIEDAGYEARAA